MTELRLPTPSPTQTTRDIASLKRFHITLLWQFTVECVKIFQDNTKKKSLIVLQLIFERRPFVKEKRFSLTKGLLFRPSSFLSDKEPSVFLSDEGPSVFLSNEGPSVFLSDKGASVFLSDEGPSVFLSDKGASVFLSDEGPSLETWDLVFHTSAVRQPFYILICISTLPTQQTTFIFSLHASFVVLFSVFGSIVFFKWKFLYPSLTERRRQKRQILTHCQSSFNCKYVSFTLDG